MKIYCCKYVQIFIDILHMYMYALTLYNQRVYWMGKLHYLRIVHEDTMVYCICISL